MVPAYPKADGRQRQLVAGSVNSPSLLKAVLDTEALDAMGCLPARLRPHTAGHKPSFATCAKNHLSAHL